MGDEPESLLLVLFGRVIYALTTNLVYYRVSFATNPKIVYLKMEEKTVKRGARGTHEQLTFCLQPGSLCNTCHLWEGELLNFVAMEAFMPSCSSNFSEARSLHV